MSEENGKHAGAGSGEAQGVEPASMPRAGLRLRSLSMENIGPFDRAEIEFASGDDGAPAVTILTGENGTGKTIVLDAIRGMFGPQFATLEREIWRKDVPFRIHLEVDDGDRRGDITSVETAGSSRLVVVPAPRHALPYSFDQLPGAVSDSRAPCPPWVVHYWRSSLTTDSFKIQSLQTPQYKAYLRGALDGHYKNSDTVALLTYFDYLRDSRDPRERKSGEALYEAATRIVAAGLLDGGELANVSRTDLMPMVRQAGQEIPLSNISSGNAYLIQRMIELLGKMFSVHVLRQTDPAELCETPGVLLIDEAENHLHPRWQKRFLRSVLDVFPNLQIIATTHSPFIVSSIPGARVFVCRYERDEGACTITDETADYANKPIEEILASDAFDGTRPFNEQITNLLEERDRAIDAHDDVTRKRIEHELLARNPLYFRYFEVEERLAALTRGAA